jgi:branched-chain amino acid transport system permease protein
MFSLYTSDVINQTLILVMLAVSLNLVFGSGGQVSVAHAAFAAIGAYTAGYLGTAHHVSPPLAILAGVLVAAVGGGIVSLPALRLSGEYVMLLTLAVQTIVLALAQALPQFGGTNGIIGLPPLVIFGINMSSPTQALPALAVITVLVIGWCWWVARSSYGLILRGVREDELVVRSLGRFALKYKVQVFVLSAGLAGFAGGLLAYYDAVVSPSQYGFDTSVELFAMVVIGGLGNPAGAVLGAILVSLSGPFLQKVVNLAPDKASQVQLLVYGLALVAVVMFLPKGLVPEQWRLSKLWRRREVRAVGVPAAAVPASAGMLQADTSLQPDTSSTAESRYSLVADGLSRHFGGVWAVRNASVELERGKVTALVGPNGAGKTTLFNMLSGAIASQGGRIVLDGVDVTGRSAARMVRYGVVRSFQDVRVLPALTAAENVMLGVQHQAGASFVNLHLRPWDVLRSKRAVRAEAQEWLEFVGLAGQEDVSAGELGFGEQKLLALARLLATRAPVLLLDEPGSGVDATWLDRIVEIVKQIRDQGRTVCIVEHNLDVVRRLADRVYFMDLGKIVAAGTVDELMDNHAVVQAYFGTVPDHAE